MSQQPPHDKSNAGGVKLDPEMIVLKGDADGAHFEIMLGGAIKIEVGGSVHVRTVREWHALAVAAFQSSTALPSTLADKWPGERPMETDAEINAGALRQPRLLQDIKYEMQRVMMGARWDRPSWKRLIERMDEALSKPVSAIERNTDPHGLLPLLAPFYGLTPMDAADVLQTLIRDAQRYRWLRDHADEIFATAADGVTPAVEWQAKYGRLPAQLDDDIDAAIAAQPAHDDIHDGGGK